MKSLILILILSAATIAQELNCRVTVSFEALQTLNREKLNDFAQNIEAYMNKTKFTNENFTGDKIECTMNIYFTNATGETNYNAQLFIGSKRPIYRSPKDSPMLTIMDNGWNFSYEKGQGFYQNQSVYDPITSFLDFYAYLIIGYDLDSFEELNGTAYYSRALDIVNLGAASKFNTGWMRTTGSYSRRGLVEDLLNEKYRPFREAFFNYHYNGLDQFTTNKLEAQNNIVGFVHSLDGIRSQIDISSILIKTFFDAKYGEIIEYLRDYPNKQVFDILKKIDPPHSAKYDEAMRELD
jgi:hypothetical protein